MIEAIYGNPVNIAAPGPMPEESPPVPARVFQDPGPSLTETTAFVAAFAEATLKNNMEAFSTTLMPNFVCVLGKEDRVFHLYPCQHVKGAWPPHIEPLNPHARIMKVCEHCVHAFAAGDEMGFSTEHCRDPRYWTLNKQRYDDLKPHQQAVYRKYGIKVKNDKKNDQE